MPECFKLAQKTAPRAGLYLNDCRIVTWNGDEKEKQQFVEDQLRYVLDHGGPIDGLGIQGHFVNPDILTPPEKLWRIFDRYGKIVRELWITEFDVHTTDLQLQADYTRDFLTAAFSHPSIHGIIHFSPWAGRGYAPQASLVTKDWKIRPAGQAWLDAIHKTWWTKASGRSDKDGQFSIRGFLGDYTLTAAINGRTAKKQITLTRDGATVTLQLK
jgi:hypothetical protein